jgi:hypothetical protein
MQPVPPLLTVAMAPQFRMTLLNEDADSILFCQVQHLFGRRLVAKLSGPVLRNTCVRIDCEDSSVLGEVLSCWYEEAAVVAAIELDQALTGLAELAVLREEVWGVEKEAEGTLLRFARR